MTLIKVLVHLQKNFVQFFNDIVVFHSQSFQASGIESPYENSNNLFKCVGFIGGRTSGIPASSGVRPPFLRLQVTQEETTFSHSVLPPNTRGTTWSIVSSLALFWTPQ